MESYNNLVIYHIFIDRFNGNIKGNWKKPEFIGGNLKGIYEKLDYLADLGVNAIWLSPFYETSAYHGYHITNFKKIDSRFGTLQDLKNIIKKAHNLGIKVIADFVPNHCSHLSPFFQYAQKNKNSKYYNWFYFENWPNEYLSFLIFKELPKLNLDNKETYYYILDSAKYWLSLGIDGYRIDHTAGPTEEFFQNFSKDIKKQYPEIILFGEPAIFGVSKQDVQKTLLHPHKWLGFVEEKLFGTSEILQKTYQKEFTGNLDFTFQQLIKKFVAKKSWYKPQWLLKLLLKFHFSLYKENEYLFLFLDNHDIQRFLFEADNDKEKLKKALSIMFKQNQPVILYQGTERGMSQKYSFSKFKEHADIMAREPINWNKYDKKIYECTKKLIEEKARDN